MFNRLRPIFIELAWLFLCVLLTLLFCKSFFYWNLKHDTLDLNLHDTYFVIDFWHIFVPAFLLTTFLFFYIKEVIRGMNHTLPAIIIITSGSLAFITAVFSYGLLHEVMSKELNYGTSAYLSDIIIDDSTYNFIAGIFIFLLIVLTAGIAHTAYHFWRRKKPNRRSGRSGL